MALDCMAVLGPLHGHVLRKLAADTGVDFMGLEQAARFCRKAGYIDNRISKKIVALDTAFNVVRHLHAARASRFIAEVEDMLASVRVHVRPQPRGGQRPRRPQGNSACGPKTATLEDPTRADELDSEGGGADCGPKT